VSPGPVIGAGGIRLDTSVDLVYRSSDAALDPARAPDLRRSICWLGSVDIRLAKSLAGDRHALAADQRRDDLAHRASADGARRVPDAGAGGHGVDLH